MTEIKIQRLSLENFKCHKLLTLDFMGENASIYGDNATGKTSIYDAFVWLLFGKDSLGTGEKNMEIKPLDLQGQVRDHDALTAVEATLLVNGEEMTLRRTFREMWSTKRGCQEATYDGNTSEYYIDGVPHKKNQFQERVNGLVSEDTFRMLTSVSHFAAGIHWQERRNVLFQIAGILDDRQVMQTDSRFSPLLESLGRLSVGDYKKKLLAEKRNFTTAKTELPARISECQKTIDDIQGLDFAEARAGLENLNAQADSVNAQILAIEHNTASDAKRLERREVTLALDALEVENNRYRSSQDSGMGRVTTLKAALEAAKKEARTLEKQSEQETAYIASLDLKIADARKRWMSINAQEPDIDGKCQTCGQPLPPERLQQARAQAQARKQERLDETLAGANELKQARQMAQVRMERIPQRLTELYTDMDQAEKELEDAEGSVVSIQDLPDYAQRRDALTARLGILDGELADMARSSFEVKSNLLQELGALRDRIRETHSFLSQEQLLSYSRSRIDALREDARNAAACLEAVEKMLFLLDEYSRYKTGFVEDSINARFHLAKFRLFREQANGGVEDRCDVVYDGVPYASINNGMKINLGIDIINTLSDAYGVHVPLFVDNAESVTALEQCGSQVIRLAVSEMDKELRVQYEN